MPVEAGNNVWGSAQLGHKEIVLEARMNNPRLHSGLHSDIGNLLGVEMKSFFQLCSDIQQRFSPSTRAPCEGVTFRSEREPEFGAEYPRLGLLRDQRTCRRVRVVDFIEIGLVEGVGDERLRVVNLARRLPQEAEVDGAIGRYNMGATSSYVDLDRKSTRLNSSH